jgi:thioesterase domain-containing protein
VALVALFDAWAPTPDPTPVTLRDTDILRLFLREQAVIQAMDGAWLDEELPAADEAATVTSLLGRAHATGLLKTDLRSEQVQPLLSAYRANLRALAAYHPPAYAGRLTLFRPLLSPHPTNGWEELTSEPVEVHEMTADHYAMLAPPAVASLAQRLGCCIERALDSAPRMAPAEPELALPPRVPPAGA